MERSLFATFALYTYLVHNSQKVFLYRLKIKIAKK